MSEDMTGKELEDSVDADSKRLFFKTLVSDLMKIFLLIGLFIVWGKFYGLYIPLCVYILFIYTKTMQRYYEDTEQWDSELIWDKRLKFVIVFYYVGITFDIIMSHFG